MLALVDPWLWDFVPKDQVVFGGGTVLAARWRHRVSTDVDLFCPTGMLAVDRNRAQALEAQAEKAGCRRVAIHTNTWTINGPSANYGSLSIFADGTSVRGRPKRTLAGIRTLDNLGILRGKLHGRILRLGTFVVRDLYDFTYGACRDTRTLIRLFEGVAEDTQKSIASELRSKPSGWDDAPLIDPVAENLAANTLKLGRQLFEHGPVAFARRHGANIMRVEPKIWTEHMAKVVRSTGTTGDIDL